jgi:hypothetical protein
MLPDAYVAPKPLPVDTVQVAWPVKPPPTIRQKSALPSASKSTHAGAEPGSSAAEK